MTMKKIFIICLLFACGFLFAEEKYTRYDYPKEDIVLRPGSDFLDINNIKLLPDGYYFLGTITAIIPYENGCVFKTLNKRNGIEYEYYAEKGYKFYTRDYTEYKDKIKENTKEELASQCLYPYIIKIVDIKPNLMTVRFEIEE